MIKIKFTFWSCIIVCLSYHLSSYNFTSSRLFCEKQVQNSSLVINSQNPVNTNRTTIDKNASKIQSNNNASLSETTINNILTWFSGAIGILTILLALFGIFEFNQVLGLRKKVDSFDSRLKTVLESLNNEMNAIKQRIVLQGQSLQKHNEFLYRAAEKIANETGSIDLLEEVTRNYQIAILYIPNNESEKDTTSELFNLKKDAFLYIQQKGNKDDIPHLQFIAEHDTNIVFRKLANQTIGHIKEREGI